MNRKPKLSKDLKKKNVVKKKKTILSPRSTLQHLNGAAGSISGSTNSSRYAFGSSSSSFSSSSLSTEAPTCTLPIFISTSSSSETVRKPQIPSTTASKPIHNSKTARAVPSCFRSNKSVKVNRLNTNPLKHKHKLNPNIASKQQQKKKTTVEQTCTPAAGNNKLVKVEEEDDSTKNTPPIQISVSPEIQGGLSISVNAAPTPSCYAAGHLLSGVTDRRKCRPRGILAVGNNRQNNADLHEFSSSSLFMRPLEASMRWLCNNGDQKHVPGMFSPPAAPSSCEVITLQEKMKKSYDDLDIGNNWSPFSIDSLCSDNVIKTPESDSIFNHYCCKGDDHYPEIQSFEVPLRENLSPEDSIGNCCSIDCSSMKELFGSKLSLSLKDGIDEIEDEPNYCRYLSDDEKDDNECRKFDFPESFRFDVMNGEESNPPQHKVGIIAESLTIDGDSISDLFSRSSNHS